MSIIFGLSLISVFFSAIAFTMKEILASSIGLVLTIILVWQGMCYEGHLLKRIQKLEKEIERLSNASRSNIDIFRNREE